jgi:hypothetical protein
MTIIIECRIIALGSNHLLCSHDGQQHYSVMETTPWRVLGSSWLCPLMAAIGGCFGGFWGVIDAITPTKPGSKS